MREIILAVFNWLHLIAAVVWIGGIFFILFIGMPSAKKVLGADAGKLMGEISRRFTPIANYSIIFIVVTGAALTGLNREFSGITNFENTWFLTLIVKHVLVFGMVAVHFYRGLILVPKIGRTEAVSKKTSLQKLSFNLVRLNFCLGVIILLFSGIISTH